MLTMEGWATIRYLHAQGKSVRAIANELGVARNTVRHALRTEGPPKYERAKRANPQLDPFHATIRELYFQKHLIGSRILREIRAKGYRGGPTAEHLHGIMALASLYDERSMRRAFVLAREYKTYSHAFIRGLLESRAIPQAVDPEQPADLPSPRPSVPIRADLRPYQQLLWEAMDR